MRDVPCLVLAPAVGKHHAQQTVDARLPLAPIVAAPLDRNAHDKLAARSTPALRHRRSMNGNEPEKRCRRFHSLNIGLNGAVEIISLQGFS